MDIIACGFGWSGSGAVIDFIRDQARHKVFPGGEVQFVKYEGGLYDLVRRVQKTGTVDAASIDRLVTLLMGSLPEADRLDRECNKRMRRILDEGGTKYVSVVERYAEQLRAFEGKPLRGAREEVVHLTRVFFSALMELFRTKRLPWLILNQGIRPTNLTPLKFLDNTKVIIVRRDPRDSYFERCQYQVSNRKSVEEFIENFRMRNGKFERTLSRNSLYASRIKVIDFERLVLSQEVREDLLGWLNIVPVRTNNEPRFVPAKSKGNIGVYRHHKKQEEMDLIAAELTDFIVD